MSILGQRHPDHIDHLSEVFDYLDANDEDEFAANVSAASVRLHTLETRVRRIAEAYKKGPEVKHAMTCPAWGPGGLDRPCRCGAIALIEALRSVTK